MKIKTLVVTTLLTLGLSTGLFAGETGENYGSSNSSGSTYRPQLTLEQEVHRELSRIKVKPTDKMRISIPKKIIGGFFLYIYFKGLKINLYNEANKAYSLFKAAFGRSFTKEEYSKKIKIVNSLKQRRNVEKIVEKFNSLILESREVREKVAKAYRQFFYEETRERVKNRIPPKKLISLYFCMGGGFNNSNPQQSEIGLPEIEGSIRLSFYFRNPVEGLNLGLIFEPYILDTWNIRFGANLLFSLKIPFKKFKPSSLHLALGFGSMFIIKENYSMDKVSIKPEVNSFNSFIPMVVFEIGYLYHSVTKPLTFFFTIGIKYGFKSLVKDFISNDKEDTPNYFAFIMKAGIGFNL